MYNIGIESMYTAYFNYLLVPYTPNTLYIHVTLVIPLCFEKNEQKLSVHVA